MSSVNVHEAKTHLSRLLDRADCDEGSSSEAGVATGETVESYCIGQGFALLPVTLAHAAHAGAWPHGDPFDRMLAAQGLLEHLQIATNDPQVAAFGVETVW